MGLEEDTMTKTLTAVTGAILAVGILTGAATAKPMAAMKGKMVPMYQAAICHMYFTPAQAKMDHYACPISKGKMHKVMVSPAMAKMQMAKTNKAMMGMKKKAM
jgi:hypothetical protein